MPIHALASPLIENHFFFPPFKIKENNFHASVFM